MEALSVIRLFSTSKEGIDSFVQKVVSSVESGDIDPLQLKVYLKSIEAAIEAIDKQTRESQLIEASKYSEKNFDAFGAKIQIKENGTKYDYSKCGDLYWERCKSSKDTWSLRQSERESFLKCLKEKQYFVEKETGDVYECFPPTKTSTTGLTITIK